MSRWSDAATRAIGEVHRILPEGIPLAERTAAVDAAYPFGERAHHPYKAWLKARREYLGRYGYRPKTGKQAGESPLERLMRRGPA